MHTNQQLGRGCRAPVAALPGGHAWAPRHFVPTKGPICPHGALSPLSPKRLRAEGPSSTPVGGAVSLQPQCFPRPAFSRKQQAKTHFHTDYKILSRLLEVQRADSGAASASGRRGALELPLGVSVPARPHAASVEPGVPAGTPNSGARARASGQGVFPPMQSPCVAWPGSGHRGAWREARRPFATPRASIRTRRPPARRTCAHRWGNGEAAWMQEPVGLGFPGAQPRPVLRGSSTRGGPRGPF